MKILDLLSNEKMCSKLFRAVRWRNGIYCPRCGSRMVKKHGNYRHGLKRYKCKAADKHSTTRLGRCSTTLG